MKVLLMDREQDFDAGAGLADHGEELIQDLALNTLFNAMANGDDFIFSTARSVFLTAHRNSPDTIVYRQNILKDCLRHPTVVRQMYDLAVGLMEGRKRSYWGIFTSYPTSTLSSAVGMLEMYMDYMEKLKNLGDTHARDFVSAGFTRFFTMLRSDLDDTYLVELRRHLRELRFENGVLMSAILGWGNEVTGFTVRKTGEIKGGWWRRWLNQQSPSYTFYIAERDETGAKTIGAIRDRAINPLAEALAQAADHILAFFTTLRTETAFYVGCLNLYERLSRKGEEVCMPVPLPGPARTMRFLSLYDPCLTLTMNEKIIGNDLDGEDRRLFIITGANQGGKSTFLRSIGVSQLMMQCGMFVPALSYTADVCDGIYTHFRRGEDSTIKSGKLDEELGRMNTMADRLTSRSLILFNESFSATNEREGAEIARQIVTALIQRGVKVFFVTHLYPFARDMLTMADQKGLFLRAQRRDDGSRTFRIQEGDPLQTSFGQDVYYEIFGE